MLTIIGAAILPFILLFLAVRLTHSFTGGILVSIIVTAGVQPWNFGTWTAVVAVLSLMISIPVVFRLFKGKKKGP